MDNHNQNGSSSILGIWFVVLVVLFIGVTAFAIWAFSSRQEYKNNVDSKIASAVTAAQTQQKAADTAANAVANKYPLTTYNGPYDDGSIVLKYPKTWSGYVDTSDDSSSTLLDGYFNPNIIPSVTDSSSVFALRVQVLAQSYATSVANITQSDSGDNGTTPPTVTAYTLPKVPSVVGIEAVGTINNQQETLVVLPLRSDTIEIWTEGTDYVNDFNQNILPNFSFSP